LEGAKDEWTVAQSSVASSMGCLFRRRKKPGREVGEEATAGQSTVRCTIIAPQLPGEQLDR